MKKNPDLDELPIVGCIFIIGRVLRIKTDSVFTRQAIKIVSMHTIFQQTLALACKYLGEREESDNNQIYTTDPLGSYLLKIMEIQRQ